VRAACSTTPGAGIASTRVLISPRKIEVNNTHTRNIRSNYKELSNFHNVT
jgi:hypothetical protein